MPDGSIVAFNICVLLRLSELTVLDSDTLLLGPYSKLLADVLRAIVAPDCARFAAPFDDAVQAADDPLCGQREVNLDPQTLTVEVVQDIQQPKSPAVAEAIRHKVHGPGHIGRVWHRQGIRLLPFQPLSGLDPQVQFQLAVDPIDAFMVPGVTFDVPQMQETQAKSPCLTRVCQPRQQIGNHLVLVL